MVCQLLLLGCGGGTEPSGSQGPPPPPPPPPVVTTLELVHSDDRVAAGLRGSLRVRLKDQYGQPVSGLENGAFTISPPEIMEGQWTNSPEPAQRTIAFRGLAIGAADLTIRVDGVSYTRKIQVSDPVPARLVVDSSQLVVPWREQRQLQALLENSLGARAPVAARWQTADTAVASVMESGLASGKYPGSATITARFDTVTVSGRLVVPHPRPYRIRLSGDTLRVRRDRNEIISFRLVDAAGAAPAGVEVTATSTHPSIARPLVVSPNALRVEGLREGNGSIRVSTADDTVLVPVVVGPNPVVGWNRTSASHDVALGDSTVVQAVPLDTENEELLDRTVTWTTSDPTVATIRVSNTYSAVITVTAVSVGKTTLTATCEGASTTIQVSVIELAHRITPENDSLTLVEGQATQLNHILVDSSGSVVVGVPVTLRSSSTAIVTVSDSGRIAALQAGRAEIVLTASTRTRRVPVRVISPDAATPFEIELRMAGDVPAAARAAMRRMAARWRDVISADLRDVPVSLPANACAPAMAPIAETVDDLVVYVRMFSGPRDVFARAGPCLVRAESHLPVISIIEINTNAQAPPPQPGGWDAVALHELGHALGMTPDTWTRLNLAEGLKTFASHFTGPLAHAGYARAGSVALREEGVPLENEGEDGARDSHWRAVRLGSEIMTPFILGGVHQAVSSVTVGALADMGYTVNAASADGYRVPGAPPASLQRRLVDVPIRPWATIDRRGVVRPLPR